MTDKIKENAIHDQADPTLHVAANVVENVVDDVNEKVKEQTAEEKTQDKAKQPISVFKDHQHVPIDQHYVRITVFQESKFYDIQASQLTATLQEQDKIIWVDMVRPNEEDYRILTSVFKFHPLAIEDTRNTLQRPKVDEYVGYLFILMNTIQYSNGQARFEEIDVFLGTNYIVTIRTRRDRLIEQMRARLCEDGMRVFIPTTGYLMYVLSDVVVDSYFGAVDQIGEQIDTFEEQIVNDPHDNMLQDVFRLKRTLTEVWRVVSQQRDMFSVLLHRDKYVDSKTLGIYFSDVYDHVLRITDNVNAYRDISTSLVELFMSATSNRLNKVVNRLAIVTIIIGIATVISGFYGMNFERTWPDFSTPWGVPYVVGAIVVSSILAVILMKRSKMF